MLDRNDIKSEWKYMADDIQGGLECATDSTVNPVLFTYSLAITAKRLGARLKTHTTVTKILLDAKGAIEGVETSSGLIYTKQVVNAAGVWSKHIGQMVGIKVPIEPRKGHILVSSRTASIGTRKVMEFSYLMSKFGKERKVDEETKKYGVALVFEPTASQNFLIGSSREFVGFQTQINIDVIRCIARRAIRFFPVMKEIPVLRSYCGLRPWTPDHLPIVSRVEEVPGFYIAAGHEGDGISLAAITGKVICEMITEQKTTISTNPLRYDRFQKMEVRT
jgi:sarcosine oxidase subunit beta